MGTVVLAALVPARGAAFQLVDGLAVTAIALLFLLHGLRLPRAAVLQGLGHWRLHLVILGVTFLAFPVFVVLLQMLMPGFVAQPLWAGMLFLAALPSTVQSSIAFTSMARGNVAGAVVAAAASNLLGIVLTPFIVMLLSEATGASVSLAGVGRIALLLLAPFVLGQILRRWLADWVEKTRRITSFTDRATIILAVYVAFSEATNEGLWQVLPVSDILRLAMLSVLLLALVMLTSGGIGRMLGFSREDRIAIVFCGSKKSLATGIPMAKLLFAGSMVGPVVLPLMIFHQIQLVICAWLAQRWARR
ncbi:bile acid:sodium symporter [Tardibacter chloracetimidivorans]|uniref:Bile acid:sodium symporter n=2 Tax=Tardibacter chloracetimidivorans TaxID=1921510 RepID=A0A1L3ZZ56_9SPHN|nr:bile acid:sodium symporter [Tardibacter chloracetimidivorans]